MKRLILFGLALVLSWISCRDAAFSDVVSPDINALTYPGPDNKGDRATLKTDPEAEFREGLFSILTDLSVIFQDWSSGDLFILIQDTEEAEQFAWSYLNDPEQQQTVARLMEALSVLRETSSAEVLQNIIAEIASSVFPVDPPGDAQQAVRTPCYDEYQTKVELAGVGFLACAAFSSPTVIGPSVCLTIYAATLAIYTRDFIRCVRNGGP